MRKDEITVIYGTDYMDMTIRLLETVKLADLIPSKDTLIGIKPNLVGQVLASDGATTHPEVVEGLIRYLQSHDFTRIVMLEGSWVGDTTPEAVRFCGFERLSKEYAVPFLDMQQEPGIDVDCGGMKLKICKAALEIEFLINVPVLKGHCQTGMTCALKNMKGIIPNSEKRRFHRLGLHEPIAHLSLGRKQDFILVDSICGDLTFEDGGNPVIQNRVYAALDPVLADAYGCFLMDMPKEQVTYLVRAQELGVGCSDLENAKIEVIDPPEKEVSMESGYGRVMKLAERTQEVDSCSACYGYLLPALEMLDQEGLLDRLDEKICIGQGHRGKSGKLGVGNCTKRFQYTIEGCPPTELQMYEFLKRYLLELQTPEIPENS